MTKKPQTQTGGRALRAIFEDANRAVEEDMPATSPDPNLPRNGWKAGKWPGFPSDSWPPEETGIRVKVIGRDAGGAEYFCLSSTGHFRTITRWDNSTLVDLFAPDSNTAKFCWPAFGKTQKRTDAETGEEVEFTPVKRIERDSAVEAIMNEAARKPTFDPYKQHRGRGGWVDTAGRFIWHSGNWLWSAGPGEKLTRARPMQHDGFLYTREAPTVEPWQKPVSHDESPARRILEDLRTWKWQRPYLDPVLVLGWLGVAIMGGALRQRPIVFTTGGAGVGKSTLQELLIGVLGDIVTTTVNTTAAGIYQRAKKDSLPFMVDELESKPGSSRAESVIELARVAYTGGDISRGGADHEATTFTARQSFFFSAINAPPMNTQDKTRMALLNLARLDQVNGIDRKPFFSDVDARMILRQVIDGFAGFYPSEPGKASIYQNYWDALSPHGLDSRAINTFGTLLAAAELLVGPEALEACHLPVTEPMRLGEIVAEATRIERSENLDNWHKCVDHLFQSTIDSWREGIKPTIGHICERVLDDEMQPEFARERLQLVNLGVVAKGKVTDETGPCLAVPASGPALTRLFADTEFNKGVWYTALKQAPTHVVIRDAGNKQKVKINGSTTHCLLIDLKAFEAWARTLGKAD